MRSKVFVLFQAPTALVPTVDKFPFRLLSKPILLSIAPNAIIFKLFVPVRREPSCLIFRVLPSEITYDPKKPSRPPGLPAELRGTQPVPAELYCPAGRSDRQYPEGRSASRLIMLPALLVSLPQRVRRWPIYQDSAPPAPRLARVSTCISLAAFSATQRIHQNGVIRVNVLQVLFSRLRRHVFF